MAPPRDAEVEAMLIFAAPIVLIIFAFVERLVAWFGTGRASRMIPLAYAYCIVALGTLISDSGVALPLLGSGLVLSVYAQFGSRFHPMVAAVALAVIPAGIALDPEFRIFPSQRYWFHDWSEILDGKHPVLFALSCGLAVATLKQWWVEFRDFRPRPNSGGTALGLQADAQRRSWWDWMPAVPNCFIIGSAMPVFALLMGLPEKELPAEVTVAVLVAWTYVAFALQGSVDSALALAWHWPGVIVSRRTKPTAGHLAGTVRVVSEQFEGMDGAGPCVCAIPGTSLRRGGGAESRGVPFVVETASGPIGLTADEETGWGGMTIAATSKRRLFDGLRTPEAASTPRERDWLCLRDGDEVVIWCSAKPTDASVPGLAGYRGAALRCFAVDRHGADETALVGLGSLEEQRREIWRTAIPPRRTWVIAPAVLVCSFIAARCVHMWFASRVLPFWQF